MPRRRLPPRVMGPYEDVRNGTWYLITVERDAEGKSKRVRTAAESKDEALDLKAELEAEIEAPQELTVEQAIQGYLAARRRAGIKPVSADCYERALQSILPPEVREGPLARLTPRRAQALYDHLVDRPARTNKYTDTTRPRSAASHRNDLAQAKALGKWAEEHGHLSVNPFAKVKPVGRVKRGPESKPQLRIDEARLWCRKALELARIDTDRTEWDRSRREGGAMALVALYMGPRASEVAQREVRDLDDRGPDGLPRVLHIERAKTRRGNRLLDIPLFLRPILARCARDKLPTAKLFEVKSREGVRYWVRRICTLAGVSVVCTHSLRGLRATLDALAGRRLRDTAEDLGHLESETRQSYVQPAALEQAASESVFRVLEGGRR